MKQISKSQDNVIVCTAGIIANNTTYAYDLSNKQLKLYVMYTDKTTPQLSAAVFTRNNIDELGGLKILDQSSNKGEIEFMLHRLDLEPFALTATSNYNLYLALYEVKPIINAEMYTPLIKPDMYLELVE